MPLNKYRQELGTLRTAIIELMESQSLENINCLQCTGVCCTRERNSMQVTPLEALELYTFLKNHFKNELEIFFEKNEQCIQDEGLHREMYIKGKLFRKNYTCSLFKWNSFGCPIDNHWKPYGCLGYNPVKSEVKNGENCESRIDYLEMLNQQFSKRLLEINQEITHDFKIDWEKKPIPVALKFFYNRDKNLASDQF